MTLATILVGAGASAAAAKAPNTLVLSPQTGPAGTLVNASGMFADHCGVRLSWDAIGGTVLAEPPVGRDGTYAASVLVPANAGAGSHLVVAVGLVLARDLTCSLETSNVARQTFTVVTSGGAPSAGLILSADQARPGQGVVIDGSASVGEIDSFDFDLDGNGTYETSCGGPKAAVVRNERGTRSIGLRITTADGRTATARAPLTIAGATAPPPEGGPTMPMQSGTIVGSCVDQQTDLVDATVKAWMCPQTVFVGVVEATFRKSGINPAKQDACFERHEGKSAGIDVAFFVASKNSPNAVGNPVLVNGLEFDHPVETTYPKPFYKNELMLMETIPLLGAFGPYGPSSPKTSDFRITMRSPGPGTSVASEPFSLAEPWDISKPGVAHWVTMGKKTYLANNEFLGLSVAKKLTSMKFAAGYSSRLTLHTTLPFTNFQLVSSVTSAVDVVAINNGGSTVASPAIKAGPSWGRRAAEATTQISFTGIKLGIFTMNASLAYTQQGTSDVWAGDMDLIFPGDVTVEGALVIRDGEFESAHVEEDPGPPGWGPIGCCVWIYSLFGDLTPSYVGAGANFGIGPTVSVVGVRAAEVTGQAQIFYGDPWAFVLSASDLKLAGIDVNASAKVAISSSGFFGSAFLDEDWGPLELQANLAAKVTGSTWFAGGAASVCVDLEVVEGCGGGAAGIGKKGVAGCAVIPYLPDGGVALQWDFFTGDLLAWDIYWGCSFGKVESHAGAKALNRSRAVTAGGLARAGVRVEEGLGKVLFAVEGAGAPPKVTLSSPDGATIASDPGEPVASGPGWTLVELPHDNTTYVTVEEPAPGSWEITEQAGSTITSIGVAPGLPKRVATGNLRGTGRARTLRYQIADIDGVRVTFVERGGDPTSGDAATFVEHVIGTASGGSGSIRFAPAESSIRHRSIEAVISVGGIPVATEKIGSYTAPPLAPLPATKIDVHRSREAVTIGWTRVPGASFYRVEVDRSDGPTDVFDVSGLDLRVGGITPRTTTRIVVRAVSLAGYFGTIARAISSSAITGTN